MNAKHRLLAVILVTFYAGAHAEQFESRNKRGGAIVLTDRSGGCDGQMLQAYSVASGSPAIFGCWMFAEKRVWVIYSDGDVRVYDPDGFGPKSAKK